MPSTATAFDDALTGSTAAANRYVGGMGWLKTLRRRTLGPSHEDARRAIDFDKLERIMALLNDQSQPNINAVTQMSRNLDMMALSVKALGYQLATQMAAALPPAENTEARRVPLRSKPSTQRDMESEWVRHWCSQLGVPVIYHRKLWELAYILQVAYNTGNLRAGRRGLGFGCGTEPLTSYFASCGVEVTMTDLAPDDARTQSWTGTNQHASTLDDAHIEKLVSREQFDALVRYRSVDMNAIPDDLANYDFCWSTCALEHLGSIEHGLAFIENSLRPLRPGGTAIHTTEFNINPLGPTIDNWGTVLFQRRHFETLGERLTAAGHKVARLDFNPGNKPLDQFIDLPPWDEGTMAYLSGRLGSRAHLKVAIDGFVTTCYGITVSKAG